MSLPQLVRECSSAGVCDMESSGPDQRYAVKAQGRRGLERRCGRRGGVTSGGPVPVVCRMNTLPARTPAEALSAPATSTATRATGWPAGTLTSVPPARQTTATYPPSRSEMFVCWRSESLPLGRGRRDSSVKWLLSERGFAPSQSLRRRGDKNGEDSRHLPGP